MQVQDVMVPVAGHITREMNLREASEMLKGLNIDPMPVVENGKVVGVLSEKALQARAAQDGLATGTDLVADVMSTDVHCVRAEEQIEDVLAREHGQAADSRRLPVVDDRGVLVGLVSPADLRRRAAGVPGGVDAMDGVESISELVEYDDDPVDFISDASFPASDPMHPPSTLTGEEQ